MTYPAYMTRLKPGVDDELIRFLEPYHQARRVSEVLRAALIVYVRGGAAPVSHPVQPPAPLPVPAIAPPVPAGDVLSKARSAFFK